MLNKAKQNKVRASERNGWWDIVPLSFLVAWIVVAKDALSGGILTQNNHAFPTFTSATAML